MCSQIIATACNWSFIMLEKWWRHGGTGLRVIPPEREELGCAYNSFFFLPQFYWGITDYKTVSYTELYTLISVRPWYGLFPCTRTEQALQWDAGTTGSGKSGRHALPWQGLGALGRASTASKVSIILARKAMWYIGGCQKGVRNADTGEGTKLTWIPELNKTSVITCSTPATTERGH